MDRRAFLAGLTALSAGCLADLPEPSGPRVPPSTPEEEEAVLTPQPDLHIIAWDVAEGPDGGLTVPVTVENRDDRQRSGLVRATAVVGGDGTSQAFDSSAPVTVPASETVETTLTFDVAFERFVRNGEINDLTVQTA